MPPAVYSSGHESLLADDQLQGKWEKYPLHITVSRSGQNRITVHAFRPNARGTNGVCEPGRTYDSLPEAKLPEVPGANSETFGSALESGRGIYLGRDNEYHVQPSWSHVASGDKRDSLFSRPNEIPIACYSNASDKNAGPCETAHLYSGATSLRKDAGFSTRLVSSWTGPRIFVYPGGTMPAVALRRENETEVLVDDSGKLIYDQKVVDMLGRDSNSVSIEPHTAPPEWTRIVSSAASIH